MLFWLVACVAAQLDVAQTMQSRLAESTSELGNVAEKLLSVQSDVNRVEQESLGKVFDLETIKTFFDSHQNVMSENEALKKQAENLEAELASLRNDLSAKSAENAEMKAQASTESQIRERLEAQNTVLQLKVNETADAITKCQTNATSLTKSNTALEAAKAQLENDRMAAAHVISQLHQQVKDQETKLEAGAEAKKDLEHRVELAEKGVEDLKLQLQAATQERLDKHSELEAVKVDAAKAEVEHKAELQKATAEKAAADQALKDMKDMKAEKKKTLRGAKADADCPEIPPIPPCPKTNCPPSLPQRKSSPLQKKAPRPDCTSVQKELQQMQKYLIEQHNYGLQCHARVLDLEKNLPAEEQAALTSSPAPAVIIPGAVSTSPAPGFSTSPAPTSTVGSPAPAVSTSPAPPVLGGTPSHINDNILSLQKLVDNLKSENTVLKQKLTEEEMQLTQTQYQTAGEFQKLKGTVGELSTHAKALESSLSQNIKERKNAEEVSQGLKKQLLSISTVELEHKIGVLESEVGHANKALEACQISEAKAKSEAQQAIAYQKAAEETATLNADAARKAAVIAQEEVAKATQQNLIVTQEAEKKALQAETDMSQSCNQVWDERNKDFDQVKLQLADTQAKLQTSTARVELLTQSCEG